jgi:hypothetical protein
VVRIVINTNIKGKLVARLTEIHRQQKKTLTVVGLGLQRCTCKVSAGGSEIMLRHATIML